MRRSGWARFDLAPLAHPIWWVALILLVVNDHLLKGARVVPGWLTGKVSDFAFLIVAPVLAAAALPCAIRRRRGIALFAVGWLFAAAKLSPAVSDALVATLRHVGIVWRLWPDPTDLVALVALPLAGHVLRAPPGRLARLLPRRAGVLLGAVACAATSAPPSYLHNPFLVNAAPATETVQVSWVLRKLPCTTMTLDDLGTATAASLSAGDLDDPIQIDLAQGQVAPLDGPPPAGASLAGTCTTNALGNGYVECVGAVLQAPSAAPVLMVAPASWREYESGGGACSSSTAPVSRCKPQLDPAADAGPDAVTLKDVNGQLQFVAGSKVRITPIDPQVVAARTAAANSCRALRDQYESLVHQQACSSDSDCVALASFPIAPAPGGCGLDVTLPGARAVEGLWQQWQASCIDLPVSGCTTPQPAVCRAGSCAPVCPGETIPGCPALCYGTAGTDGAACTGTYGWPCARPGGLTCDCVNGKITCRVPQPVSATCPLTCLDYPGGGTYVDGLVLHPPLDGGSRTDGGGSSADAGRSPPDGGAADARD
jgi:hypothetical protein